MSRDSLSLGLFTYSTKPRGGVVHTLNLAEHLAELGHDPRVYALGRRDEDSFFRDVGVPTTIVPFEKREDESFSERVKRYIRRFYEYLHEGELKDHDVCHSQDCISANALWRLRDDGTIPFFVRTVHHVDEFKTQSLVECQDNSITRPDRRIVVSDYWKKRLHEQFGVSATVIPNGVDLDQFKPAESKSAIRDFCREQGLDDRRVFLSIGGIEPRKNAQVTLEAFETIADELRGSDRPATWVIAGGKTLFDYRDYRDEFFRKLEASSLKRGEDVRILGSVTDETILRLYQSSDVLLFVSRKEGFGLVALEAMACELPVVASTIDVFREFMVDGENARLVDPDDPTAIAEAGLRLLDDRSLRKRLLQNGRETAKDYSWRRTAQRHEEFYRRVLDHMKRLKDPFGVGS